MDSVKRSAVTPSKSRLARTFAKVLSINKSMARITSNDHETRKSSKSEEKLKKKKNQEARSIKIPWFVDEDDESLSKAVVQQEAFLAKLFARISTVKAAYAQLQFHQSPYDPDGIQSADHVIVSELKYLSELKQCFLKQQLHEASPDTTLLLSEIQEQKSLLITYDVTSKKLNSQLKLKDSEITFLKEKLAEANRENKVIERRLNSSGHISVPDNVRLSSLRPSHFIAYLKQTVKSIRGFVRLLISEMESANWDLDVAASSIEPGVSFWKPNDKCFAFESYVCKQMLDGFNHLSFSENSLPELELEDRCTLFFDRFTELKSVSAADYLAWKPKSLFATFCRKKYLNLVRPKMEASLFGNLDQRNLVNSGETPETSFFTAFSEMAKRVWLLHCLGLSFEPEVTIFQVSKGSRFSEVYMESLSDEAFMASDDGSSETGPWVAFTVVPGFRIGTTIVQSQVYLY